MNLGHSQDQVDAQDQVFPWAWIIVMQIYLVKFLVTSCTLPGTNMEAFPCDIQGTP